MPEMSPAFLNRTGHRYGRLTVLSREPNQSRSVSWRCRCDCGNETVVFGSNLHTGNTLSCGCLVKPTLRARKHGDTGSAEYWVWTGMHQRCRDPNHVAYHHYGGRGIAVCDRWKTYANFLADIGRRPSSKFTLERINNDEGYSPENCTWATWKQQVHNRRLPPRSPYCAQGHLWTPETTFTTSQGWRRCRTCLRERTRRHKEDYRCNFSS